jgi:hypothetical protein
MEKVFAIKMDANESALWDRFIERSGLKNGAALFRLLIHKYDKEQNHDN